MEDIAVIGIGLRFPGDASSPEALWSVLENGESQWSKIPEDRLNINGYYHPSGERQGSISFKGAHFLKSNVADFDAPFFSIAAADAKAMDPQQRLLLEVCYEALENAGCTKESIDGTDTSVYVGSFVKDYEQICLRDPDWQPQYAATGNGIAIMANRISYYFNLHGPSMTIDTGCSGSLVSVHLAAQSLRTGESCLAIAAGAGLILTPNTIMPMTALNFLSPDGKCFTFDARANGYGRGEGVGVVILKRLSDAIRDNDTIRAVIRGTQVNQDGRTTGITLPSKEAQVANIRAVYRAARLSFSDTAYVECHGTGTQAGDWRELKAISETLGTSRTGENPILVGSVKPNIGHLEGAAGVAGLIKAVLMLEHQRIPPHINFQNPNPNIDFKGWKVQVSRVAQEWPPNVKKRVSVNCFGFGGTNAHVILDGAEEYLSTQRPVAHHSILRSPSAKPVLQNRGISSTNGISDDRSWHLFCFSSNERPGVQRLVDQHASWLENSADLPTDFLANYSYTLGHRRSQLEWKTSLVSNSTFDLAIQMRSPNLEVIRSTKDYSSRVCLLFCGQGSQWAQMGADLRSFPVFWNSLNSASWYLKTVLNSPFDLLEEIARDSQKSRISEPHISQPATTALQIALVDLLQSLSIEPDFVIGHSSGEIAAAFSCGAISREEAWEVAYYRGSVTSTLETELPGFRGGMIVVSTKLDDAISYIHRLSESLEIACVNSPNSITLSGKLEAIEQAAVDLTTKNIRHRVLPVGMPYHSSYMTNIADEYVQKIASISPSNGRKTVRMFSSVTGAEIRCSELDAGYWGKNMVSTVQFSSALDSMMTLSEDVRPSVFIEMGPSTVLRAPVLDTLSFQAKDKSYFSALDKRRPGIASILSIVGELWARGYKVNLKSALSRRLPQPQLKCLPDLPSYPWNHTNSYWHESHLSLANRFRKFGRLDLIGAPTADSVSFEPRWRGFIRISENPWIQDHQVQKTVIYPAAGMISMVLEGARQLKNKFPSVIGYELRNVSFEKAIIVPNTSHGIEVALNMRAESGREHNDDGQFTFSIYSKALEKNWEKNATGALHFCSPSSNWETVFSTFSGQHATVDASCLTNISPRQLYEDLNAVGISYGPMFRNIIELKKGADRCVSKIQVPDTGSKMPAKFQYPHLLHPTTLDSMFQTLFALNPEPKIPVFLQSMFVSDSLDRGSGEFVGHAIAKQRGLHDAAAEISMCCADSPEVQVIIKGLHFSGSLFAASDISTFIPNYRSLATEFVWKEDCKTAQFESFEQAIDLLCHRYPGMSVLQVGGTLLIAKYILLSVSKNEFRPPRLGRYTLVSVESSKLGIDEINLAPFDAYFESISDITCSSSKYHLILRFGERESWLPNVEDLLIPGGLGLEVQLPEESAGSIPELTRTSFTLSLNSADIHEEWCKRTKMTLFNTASENQVLNLRKFRTAQPSFSLPSYIVVLIPGTISEEIVLFRCQLIGLLAASHPDTTVSTVCLQDAAQDCSLRGDTLFISLLDFSPNLSNESFLFNWMEADFDAFHSLQRTMKTLIWVTRGASMTPSNPRASPIIGLARTLMSEDMRLKFATFDLGESSLLSNPKILSLFLTVCHNIVGPADVGNRHEVDFAEQDGKLFIPRLETLDDLNRIIEQRGGTHEIYEQTFTTEEIKSGSPIRLQPWIGLDKALSGSESQVYFRKTEMSEIGPQELDLLFDSGILLPNAPSRSHHGFASYDVVGYVSSSGALVGQYQKGDRVVALAIDGKGICTTVRVNAAFTTKYKPGFVPSHFLAAYFALFRAGNICPGKTVLIHAGASGFGLAAIELALLAEATTFVTVVGPDTDRQRDILRRRGISSSHILDGNDDGYVAIINIHTKNRGVDLVFNPTQEDLQLSISTARQCGTIVHFVSPAEILATSTVHSKPVTIVGFSLDTLLAEDRDLAAKMLHAAAHLTNDVSLNWICGAGIIDSFDVSQLRDALRKSGSSPYLGYVTIVSGSPQTVRSVVQVLEPHPTKALGQSVNAKATYVLVGGLGGLGKSIAHLLVNNGAKHIAFLSRSGDSSAESSLFLQHLHGQGVNAKAFSVDICDNLALQILFEADIVEKMPPLAGVFHCAAVIKDSVFDNMTYQSWNTGFNPKAQGAWNLVKAVEATNADPFYIFLASSAGVIGTRGQANYAAGNAFLDALARNLQMQGKHAVSLDLGPILGAGMLAEDETIMDILRSSGFYGIRHNDFLTVVKHAITSETIKGRPMPGQVVLGVGTGGLMLQNQPADPYWSRTAIYSYLNTVDMPEPDSVAPALLTCLDTKSQLARCQDSQIATDIVCAGLSSMLAKSMNMAVEEIDNSRPPSAYGVDSLVAIGVRNWVAGDCGVDISVFEILSDMTVYELSSVIVRGIENLG